MGGTPWDSTAPTPEHVAASLRALLREVGAAPPYVLVGFSWGGVLAQYFAGLHPAEVAGMVYVDPGPILTQSRAQEREPFDAIGAGEAGQRALWAAVDSTYARRRPPPPIRAEFDVWRGLMSREPGERGLRPMPEVPVVVLVAARYDPPPPFVTFPFDHATYFAADVRHRVRQLSEWALASPRGTLVLSNTTTHFILRDDPGLIVWGIRRVLDERQP